MKDLGVCVACHQPMTEVALGKAKVLVCSNARCPRVGLLSVVSLKEKKKEGGGESAIQGKKTSKQNGKKS